MKITCECGNEFDFGNPRTNDGGDVDGFEIYICEEYDNSDSITIQCKKCGEGIILHDGVEVEE